MGIVFVAFSWRVRGELVITVVVVSALAMGRVPWSGLLFFIPLISLMFRGSSLLAREGDCASLQVRAGSSLMQGLAQLGGEKGFESHPVYVSAGEIGEVLVSSGRRSSRIGSSVLSGGPTSLLEHHQSLTL